MVRGMADAYIIGEYCGGFGDALNRGFAYGKANVQTVVQLTGGTLTKAMALHLSAVLPTVGHTINLDDQYEDDIVKERIEIAEGSSPVPEAPGLGVEVDEQALAELAKNPMPEIPKHVGVLTLPGGRKFYAPSIPPVSRLTGFPEGTIRGLDTEVWEEDGSEAFVRIYERVQSEGVYME